MILYTNRLVLQPLSLGDVDDFHSCNINSYVKEYLWDNEEIAVDVSEGILAIVESTFQKEKWGLWKISERDNNNFMGYVGLWIFHDNQQPELIYAMLPQYAGNGFAFEAAKRIIDYAFSELEYEYLIASMDEPNTRSIELAEKLDMRFLKREDVNGKSTLFYWIDRSAEPNINSN